MTAACPGCCASPCLCDRTPTVVVSRVLAAVTALLVDPRDYEARCERLARSLGTTDEQAQLLVLAAAREAGLLERVAGLRRAAREMGEAMAGVSLELHEIAEETRGRLVRL